MIDGLDSAGNNLANINRANAISCATLVSLALYGAFILRAKKTEINFVKSIEINDPWIFCSLLFGAMIPYAFSAIIMKSVGAVA